MRRFAIPWAWSYTALAHPGLYRLRAYSMQQPVNLLKSAARLFIVLTPLMSSACAPAWVGSWRGTADLGPVEAQSARLTLQHKPIGGSGSWRRADGAEVKHIDFSEPYTESLRRDVLAAAGRANVAVINGGCYGATQGPRLETRAEIARMKLMREPPLRICGC